HLRRNRENRVQPDAGIPLTDAGGEKAGCKRSDACARSTSTGVASLWEGDLARRRRPEAGFVRVLRNCQSEGARAAELVLLVALPASRFPLPASTRVEFGGRSRGPGSSITDCTII